MALGVLLIYHYDILVMILIDRYKVADEADT